MGKTGKSASGNNFHFYLSRRVQHLHRGHEIIKTVKYPSTDVVHALGWRRGVKRRHICCRAISSIDEFLTTLPDGEWVVDDSNLIQGRRYYKRC